MPVRKADKERHLSQPTVTCWPGFEVTIYIDIEYIDIVSNIRTL